MLVNFFTSSDLKAKFNISFSFRYSKLYWEQFQSRVNTEITIYPLNIPDQLYIYSFGNKFFRIITKVVSAFFGILLSFPIVIFQFVYIYKLLKQIKPDILHINNGSYPGALSPRVAVFVGRMLKISNIVFVVNNIAIDYKKPSRWIHYFFDLFIASWVTKFVTGSDYASLKLNEVLKLRPDQSVAIHNGINLRAPDEKISETRERLLLKEFSGLVFGIVSILRVNKGHIILLQAIKRVVESNPKFKNQMRFLIEGQGVLKDQLESYVKENFLEDICLFVGSERNVMNLMNSIDVLILPSIGMEDFPNVILEAMGNGKAVIASRLSGTPEQVREQKNGILVEPGNVEQLSQAITYILENPEIVKRMGKKSKEIFEKEFEHSYSVKKYIKLYETILKEKK
jgi:glycosyltransferase involved in cell wall biosynthesis